MTQDELYAKFPHHFSGPRRIECDSGWNDLINDFITELDRLPGGKDLVFFSIKEKFGTIRIDETNLPEGLSYEDYNSLERRYEARSSVTCEVCGKLGKKRGGSWMKTLCDKHEQERKV